MAGTPASWASVETLYTNDGYSWIQDIMYVNGYWVAIGRDQSTTNKIKIVYATDPRGTWTTVYPSRTAAWSSNSGNGTMNVVYENGKYVFVGLRSDLSYRYYYLYSASTLDGTWTERDLTELTTGAGNIVRPLQYFTYVNGYYILTGGPFGYGTENTNLAYTTDITSAWSESMIYDGTAALRSFAGPVRYESGYYYATLYFEEAGNNHVELWRCSTLTGTWANYYTFTGTDYQIAVHLRKQGSYWVLATYSGTTCIIWSATSLAGSWSSKTISSEISNFLVSGIAYGGGYWILSGRDGLTPFYTKVAYNTNASPTGGTYTTGSTLSLVPYGAGIGYHYGEFVYTDGFNAVAMSGGPFVFDPTDTVETSLGIFEPPDMAVVCQVDLSDIPSNDSVVEIRCYTKQSSGGTKKLLFSESFSGYQTEPVWQSIPVVNPYYVEFTAVTQAEFQLSSYFCLETGGPG